MQIDEIIQPVPECSYCGEMRPESDHECKDDQCDECGGTYNPSDLIEHECDYCEHCEMSIPPDEMHECPDED